MFQFSDHSLWDGWFYTKLPIWGAHFKSFLTCIRTLCYIYLLINWPVFVHIITFLFVIYNKTIIIILFSISFVVNYEIYIYNCCGYISSRLQRRHPISLHIHLLCVSVCRQSQSHGLVIPHNQKKREAYADVSNFKLCG